MADDIFRLKKFNVRHSQSSMKVGVDAVLLGSWAGESARKILEIGTGCGIISLQLAQRFPEASVLAIDIHPQSIEEAKINFSESPWSANLKAELGRFPEFMCDYKERFDLIVSNPPFFHSGISNPFTAREKARHYESLSIFSLIENVKELLDENGRLAVIFPSEDYAEALKYAADNGLRVVRECWIRNNPNRPEKRVMVEFTLRENNESINIESTHLTLFENNRPTDNYLNLCKEFYLKF